MTEHAISFRSVSKKYKLFGSARQRLFEALDPFGRQRHTAFWALRDVDFDVRKGITLGILGCNGSGKSTILQLICGVMRPTQGSIATHGRISALLELGADFSPELSGYENALWKGIRMGYSRKEMLKRLPSVEGFAEIGEFFHQPVKTYSSGMFLRLAFAVSISVSPDILVIDEALAVGDAKFQHKCFLRIRELQKQGTTIVLVTHSLEDIATHCDEAIWLHGGSIRSIGSPDIVLNKYTSYVLTGITDTESVLTESEHIPEDSSRKKSLSHFLETTQSDDVASTRPSYNANEERGGDKDLRIVDYFLSDAEGKEVVSIPHDSSFEVYLKGYAQCDVQSPLAGFAVLSKKGVTVFGTNTKMFGLDPPPVKAGENFIFRVSVIAHMSPGDYFISCGVGVDTGTDVTVMDTRNGFIHFRVDGSVLFDGLVSLANSEPLWKIIS